MAGQRKEHSDGWEETDYVIRTTGKYYSAAALYLWLRERRKKANGATPPIGDSLIAEKTGMPKRTIQANRKLLENAGLIRCDCGNGRGHRTTYEFLYPWR